MKPVSAQTVFADLEAVLEWRWIGGAAGADRILWLPVEADTPFFGRLNWVQPPRLQLLGPEEIAFLNQLEPAGREALIGCLFGPATGAALVCGDLVQAELLQPSADDAGIPLWHTPFTPTVTLERLYTYRHSLDTSTVVHGELLEVFGMGGTHYRRQRHRQERAGAGADQPRPPPSGRRQPESDPGDARCPGRSLPAHPERSAGSAWVGHSQYPPDVWR